MSIPKRPVFTGDFFFAVGLAERQKGWDDEFTNMTKDKAIEVMKLGAIVRHRFFSPGEFVKMNGDEIVDENGFVLHDFWQHRTAQHFDSGWDVVDVD